MGGWWRRRRGQGARRGQAITEMALLTPFFALILLGALDLGRLFIDQVRLNNAVKEAAIYGLYQTDPYKMYLRADDEITEPNGRKLLTDFEIEMDCFAPTAPTVRRECGEGDAGPGWVLEVRGSSEFRPITSQILRFLPADPRIKKTVRAEY
jgi:hypothetical protein